MEIALRRLIVGIEKYIIDIGRANEGRTFVRVTHKESGKQRSIVGLDGKSMDKITSQLINEIRQELAAESLQE